MDNASLIRKLTNVPSFYNDVFLHACAKRLQAGDNAEDVVVAVLEALALERARLFKECVQLKSREVALYPVKIEPGYEIELSSGGRNSLPMGKPLAEVFAEDEATKG